MRRGMNGLKRLLQLTEQICALRGDVSVEVERLWMGLLLLLRVVGVEVCGAYFGESVRNCWASYCGSGLACLCLRLRVRGKSCARQSCSWGLVDG